MLEILAQRILKAAFFAIDSLRPLLRLGVAENPSRVVLGLDHEDAISGYDDVIDLGWSPRRVQRDVVKDLVFSRWQLTAENRIDSTFASRAFNRRRPEVCPDQDEQDENY